MRLVLLLLASCLFAGCAKPAPEPTPRPREAAAPAALSPATTASPFARNPPMHGTRRRTAADAGARPIARAATPTDPRILSCEKSATDGDSLMRCLEGLRHAAPVDGGRVVMGASSSYPEHNPAWDVPNWYIRPSTGNDSNTCVDSSHPCKTMAAIVSRWGTDSPYLSVAVTITGLDDWAVNADWVYLFPNLIQGGSLTILGTKTNTCSVSLSGVVAKTLATGVADGRLHANLGACALPKSFITNSTVGKSSVAWVDDCVGSVCAISQPLQPNVPAFTNGIPPPAEVDTWANTDTVTTSTFSKINIGACKAVATGTAPSSFQTGCYLGHLWVPNYATDDGGGATFLRVNSAINAVEIRSDSYVLVEDSLVNDNEEELGNDFLGNGAEALNVFIRGGVINQPGTVFNTIVGGLVSDDAVIHGTVSFGQRASDVMVIGPIYNDGALNIADDVDLIGDVGPGIVYGSYAIQAGLTFGTMSTLYFTPPATTAFGGVPSWQYCGPSAFANAFDRSVTPGAWYPRRTLSAAALDAPIGGPSGTGFGGAAYCDNGATITATNAQQTAAPVAYVAPTGNGGTGLDAGCPDGATYEGTGPGTPPQCVYVPVSTLTDPVTVPHGGTADTTLTAHSELLGEGTSPVSSVGPCNSPGSATTGIATIWPNNTSDPICGTVSVPGGGTGVQTITSGCAVIGNGGNAVNVTCPSTPGNVMTSNGSTWVSSPPAGGFTCGALSSCTGGQLPLSGVTVCPNDDLFGTNHAGTNQCIGLQGGTGISVSVVTSGHINITNTEPFAPPIPLSDLAQSGATTFQFAEWNGSTWIPDFASPPHVDVTGSCSTPACTVASTSFTVPTGKRAVLKATMTVSSSTTSPTGQYTQATVSNGTSNVCATQGLGVALYNPSLFGGGSGEPALANNSVEVGCIGSDPATGTHTYTFNCGVSTSGTGVACAGTLSIDLGQ